MSKQKWLESQFGKFLSHQQITQYLASASSEALSDNALLYADCETFWSEILENSDFYNQDAPLR